MADKLITLLVTDQILEAQIIKSKLQSAGVECQIFGEHLSSIYGAATGYSIVKILESDIDLAEEVLADEEYDDGYYEEDGDMEGFEESEKACPRCRSPYVNPLETPLYVYVLSLLLMGVPLLFLKTGYLCASCRYRWKE